MMTNIMMYFLQLLNLGLLFRILLGYEFRTMTGWIVLNSTLFMMGLILRCMYWDDMPALLGIILDRMIVVFPLFVFKGDIFRILLISINFRCIFFLFRRVTSGLIQFCVNVEAIESVVHPALLTQIAIMVTLIVLYVGVQRNIKHIHRNAEHINRGLLLFLAGCLTILGREYKVSANESEEVIQLLIGQSQILSGILAVFFVAGVILLHWIGTKNKQILYLNQSNQRYIEEQTRQYKRMEEKDQALRRFHHDYKSHLNILQQYIQKERYTEAATYLSQLEDQQLGSEYISTGNLISDAILNQYEEQGKKHQIEIDYHGVVPPLESIKETEFCSLFANAVSNAFEAAMQVSGKKKIIVRVTNNEGYLFISIKNPTASPLNPSEGRLLTRKAKEDLHGFGTRTMTEIAERHFGSVKWTETDGWIETKINIQYNQIMDKTTE